MPPNKSTKNSIVEYTKNARDVLRNLQNFVYIVDMTNHFVFANKRALELFGVSNESDFHGKKYKDFAKKLGWSSNLINKLAQSDQAVLDSKEAFEHDLWLPSLNLSSKKIFVTCLHQPIIVDEELIGVYVELVDITKYKKEQTSLNRKVKKAEMERNTASLYLDRIIAHLPNIVFWVDRDSANLGCNDNLLKTLGAKSRKEIKGKTYDDLSRMRKLPLKQVKTWRRDDLKVIETGKANVNMNYHTNAEGKLIYQTTTRVPLKDDDGNIIGVIGIATDITDRVEIENKLRSAKEKAEIANQAKTDFLATVSHELRTPLNGILGMADILSRQNLKEEQMIFVKDIISSGKTLLSLINGILDLSKLEAGELEIVDAPFNVKKVAEDVISQLSTIAHKNGLEIYCKIPEDLPTNVIGDNQRLYQILINLVGNAVKFTQQGYVMLKLNVIEKTKKKAIFEFIIKDTGIGIAQEDIKLIFDRFRQLDSSYNKRHSGTGLGLDIVRQLVDLMHGKLSIESSLDKGSTFTVQLPFTILSPSKKTNLWAEKFSNTRVLIIENNLSVGKRILDQINTPNVQLVSSQRTFKALESAAKRNQHFQIIIISSELYCKDTDSLIKLKSTMLHFHNPLIISCHDLPDKSLAFKKIENTLPEEKFTTLLCQTWEEYKKNRSEGGTELKSLKPKILLVEDNLINQRVTLQMLKELYCVTDIAENGIQAIEKFKDNDYQLILMDIGLPDMDGYEATKKIRELEKNNNHIPIIALTAYASPTDKQKCLDAGMDSVVTKPINRVGLQSAISTWLLK